MSLEAHHAKKWVYCQSEGWGLPVKIGVSANLPARLSAIQGHTWREIRIFWAVPGNVAHESACKAHLRPLHIRAEWFEDTNDRIKNLSKTNRFMSMNAAPERKRRVLDYIRRDWRWEKFFPIYTGPVGDLAFATFDAEHKDALTEVAEKIGVALRDEDFAPRNFVEIESIVDKLSHFLTPEVHS